VSLACVNASELRVPVGRYRKPYQLICVLTSNGSLRKLPTAALTAAVIVKVVSRVRCEEGVADRAFHSGRLQNTEFASPSRFIDRKCKNRRKVDAIFSMQG
jgi:hypothetical protein